MTEMTNRFYENKYPKQGDLVIVEIKEVNEIGTYVSLLEYDCLQGMIPMTEMTNRRFKSVNKLAKVGRTEVVLVLSVDEEKGYIDLSKSRVSKDDSDQFEKKWNKSKCVQSIMNRVAIETSKSLIDIHCMFTWPMYKKYGNVYEKLCEYVENSESIENEEIFKNLEKDVKDSIIKNIKKRIQLSSYKIISEIDVTCMTYDGIESIKTALGCALDKYGLLGLEITLVTPPTFLVCICIKDKEYGLKIVYDSLEIISDKIKELGGRMTVKVDPYFA